VDGRRSSYHPRKARRAPPGCRALNATAHHRSPGHHDDGGSTSCYGLGLDGDATLSILWLTVAPPLDGRGVDNRVRSCDPQKFYVGAAPDVVARFTQCIFSRAATACCSVVSVVPSLGIVSDSSASPQIRPARQMLPQQPNLFRGDLVLHELALRLEKRLHVSDEGFGRVGRNL
jgi:hypothetical protein